MRRGFVRKSRDRELFYRLASILLLQLLYYCWFIFYYTVLMFFWTIFLLEVKIISKLKFTVLGVCYGFLLHEQYCVKKAFNFFILCI